MNRPTLRAFTLLELTLAVLVAALLAFVLYRSMHVCLRARRSALEAVKPVRALTFAVDVICHDFESVVRPTGILAGPFVGTRQTGSSGDADYVEFYSMGRDRVRPATPMDEGVRCVELGLKTDVSPPALVRYVTRNLLARKQADPEEEILCRNVRSLSLRYYDGLNWLEEWDSTELDNALPLAVRLEIEIGSDDESSQTADSAIRHIIRIIPLACAEPSSTSSSGSSNSQSSTGVDAIAGGLLAMGTGGMP